MLLRSGTGKVHLATGDSTPVCRVRSNTLEVIDGDRDAVTCRLCARQLANARDGDDASSTPPKPEMSGASGAEPDRDDMTEASDSRARTNDRSAACSTRRAMAVTLVVALSVVWLWRRRRR